MTRRKPPLPLDELVRAKLSLFVALAFDTLNPGDAYRHNWHIEAICYALERVREGRTKRLIITLPPRSLKSIIASVAFPAFILGHDPTRRIICASYNQDLATKMHNDFRQLIGADWYKKLFKGARIGPWKDTGQEVVLAGNGSRYATSVSGPLTGRCGDILILDDILKAQDAHSERVRTETNHWVSNTAFSRFNDKIEGAAIVIMQRLHVDDPVGYLLETTPDGWEVLNLPAIAPNDMVIPLGPGTTRLFRQDEVLHPEREPRHVLERIRGELGSAAFSAQYLQAPVPADGNLIKSAWLKYYEVPPPLTGVSISQSWDTASKTGLANDYSACVTLARCEGKHYILDVFRAKLSYPELRTKAIDHARRWGATRVYVEDTGIGTALRDELVRAGLSAIPVTVKDSKLVRLEAASPLFESGRIVLPARAPWLSEFVAELLAFPNGRHDDQVDALSQALLKIAPVNGTRVVTLDERSRKRTVEADGTITISEKAPNGEIVTYREGEPRLDILDPPISRRKPPQILKMGSLPHAPRKPERPVEADEVSQPSSMRITPAKRQARTTGILRKPQAPPPAPDEIIFHTPAPPSRPAIAPDDGEKDGTSEKDKPEGEP
jgi:predicted phage terminase large subunit-like protein